MFSASEVTKWALSPLPTTTFSRGFCGPLNNLATGQALARGVHADEFEALAQFQDSSLFESGTASARVLEFVFV